ncbi:MAG: hypothetical protein ACOC33_03780 [bacterium]
MNLQGNNLDWSSAKHVKLYNLVDDFNFTNVDNFKAKEVIEQQNYLITELTNDLLLKQTLEFYKQYVLHLIEENTILRNKIKEIKKVI